MLCGCYNKNITVRNTMILSTDCNKFVTIRHFDAILYQITSLIQDNDYYLVHIPNLLN